MKKFRMNLKSPITQFCGDFADVQKLCNSLFHSFFDTSHHPGHTPRERKLRIFFKG